MGKNIEKCKKSILELLYNQKFKNSKNLIQTRLEHKDVEWAYIKLLKRSPESREVIEKYIESTQDIKGLIEAIINSEEFRLKNSDLSEKAIMHKHGFMHITEMSEKDIFVCAWPKSGNTWCQRIISGIFWGVDTNFLTDQLAQALQPDVHFKSFYERFGTTVIWKSHNLPQPNYRRVIHIVRDGRDALLSYWHMLKQGEPGLTIEKMFESGDSLWPTSWESYSSEWIKNPYNAEIITIRYEDLLYNPLPQLKAIAKFIGRPRSEERLMEIYEGANIDNMRRIAIEHGWANKKSKLTKNFLRQGKAGLWKKEMAEDLIQKFNKRAIRVLKHYKYEIENSKVNAG